MRRCSNDDGGAPANRGGSAVRVSVIPPAPKQSGGDLCRIPRETTENNMDNGRVEALFPADDSTGEEGGGGMVRLSTCRVGSSLRDSHSLLCLVFSPGAPYL